jgi:sterol desaturase/sphingolipid hydroxylase (fatty acid hydroxylase superfamily)
MLTHSEDNQIREPRVVTSVLDKAKKILWESPILPGKSHFGMYIFLAAAIGAFWLEMLVHHKGVGLFEALKATTVTVFYNTDPVTVSEIGSPAIARLLLIAAMFRIAFGIFIGCLDITLHRKIKGEPFDWAGMVTVSIVNSIYLLTAIFTLTNQFFISLLDHYVTVVRGVPTLFFLTGPLALLVSCLMADFCYYWSHRWSHKIRLFWCLGHVNHHRTQNLTQMTQSVDPQSVVLDVAGGRAFVLLLMPIITKLFSFDVTQSGWALIVMLLFDAWTNPSHSITIYQAEIKYKFLRMARAIFVTPAVHYVHHCREKGYNKDFGCNFGARLTLWDRLFGTYVEPPNYIPKTGLYGESDYIRNPVRYVFHPFHRMYLELKLNELRYWPYILFSKTTYHPPVRVKSKY